MHASKWTFAELVIMKTRRAEQLCMFNVDPLCFNSYKLRKNLQKAKFENKSNCSNSNITYILLSNFDKKKL